MPVAIATFVLCAAIIVGSYWVFVVRPEKAASRALWKTARRGAGRSSAAVRPDEEDAAAERAESARRSAGSVGLS